VRIEIWSKFTTADTRCGFDAQDEATGKRRTLLHELPDVPWCAATNTSHGGLSLRNCHCPLKGGEGRISQRRIHDSEGYSLLSKESTQTIIVDYHPKSVFGRSWSG
jgi:hypothetical protein